MKDLTSIRRRGPQNADLTGIFYSSRLFKYSASAPHPKFKFDFEIPRDSSTRCKPIYAQAGRAAGAHFDHVARAYLRFPLRADNACVFLKNALGGPRASSVKGFASCSSADEDSYFLPAGIKRGCSHRWTCWLTTLRRDEVASGPMRVGREADRRAKTRKAIRGRLL
jgi:hypothetical protein